MRILFVIPYFYPAEFFGGPVRVAFDVGRELVKRGHEVVIYTSDAKDLENRLPFGNEIVEGMNVYYFKNSSMFLVKHSKLFITPALSAKMSSELRSFDIVHAHEYATYQNIVLHKIAKKYGVPYVLQAHGSLPRIGRRARKWIFDAFCGSNILKEASLVIALSRMEAEWYLSRGVRNERIIVVPNGVCLSEYAGLPSKGSFRKKFNIQAEKRLLLYLGRIHPTKGIELLIKSFALLVNDMKCSNIMLVLVGPDEGYTSSAKALASSLGVSDSVLFTGFVGKEDKFGALVDADVFVTPSFYGFPMTFLEACAVGVPIVTTTLGDQLAWINDNVGFVTQPTENNVAEAIYSIVSNAALREQFSRNCRNTVQSMFSIEAVVAQIEKVYEDAVCNKCM